MEPNENYLNDLLNNIPKGFRLPNEKFSSYWKYFFCSENKTKSRYQAKCFFCGIECEGRADRLPTHFLEKNCLIIPENLLNKYINDYYANHKLKTSNQNKNKQTFIEENEFDNQILNKIALKFIISANLPFRAIDNPFLRSLVNYASGGKPECRLYSSDTMKYKLLNNFITKIKLNVFEKLRTSTEITIAMDGWTDITGKSIYAVIAMSSSEECILSIEDLSSLQHTAYNLKQYLTSTIFQHNYINPNYILAVVTDTPRVMEKMKSEIQKDYKNIIPLKCILHVLNLVSKDIAHHETGREIIKDNSKMINFFKSSHMLLSWINNYQKLNNIEHTLQSYTETR